MNAFFRLYSGLDREGPGSPEGVARALDRLNLPDAPRICDAGRGSGADAGTLADRRPDARIDAVEKAPTLAGDAHARLAWLGARVRVRQDDMAGIAGPCDLFRCAWALYFLGVAEGLSAWRPALATGGRVVFSEPRLISDTTVAKRFWRDCRALRDLADIIGRVEAAGYRPRARRYVVGDGWARIATLRQNAPDPELRAVIDETEAGIAAWRAAPDDIACVLIIAEPA